MFPNGWPGAGLLLLRLIAASLALYESLAAGFRPLPGLLILPQITALVCAALTLIGLATPFAAIALALSEMWMLTSNAIEWPVALSLSGVALSLSMLGPGAISVDAHLFGRKRIDYRS